jgi:predicted RNA binding protein YcfA (HicA-like mRNA interferase family)
MSHVHQYQLTASGEWVRHLRRHHKRAFWKGERQAFRNYAASEVAVEGAKPQPLYDSLAMPVKVQELLAMPQADGWFQVRQKGSHRQLHHPSKPGTVTVAGKASVEVPAGTLNSILKQAGLKK